MFTKKTPENTKSKVSRSNESSHLSPFFIPDGNALETSFFSNNSTTGLPFFTKSPTIIQKKELDDGEKTFENKKGNSWMIDKNEETGKAVFHSFDEAQKRIELLESLNEWEEFEIRNNSKGDKIEYLIFKKGRRTVNTFIDLIKKVEIAYPGFSTEQVLNGIRALAPGYNTERWRLMLGQENIAEAIQPVKDKLTEKDIEGLKLMIEHGGDSLDNETGVVMDNKGRYLAMGHIITGLLAGINRNTETDLTSGLTEETFGNLTPAGEFVDNLYASTIAGDLGQSATILNQNEKSPLIGDNSEATEAEMYGDIDGFNLGLNQGGTQNTIKLSSLLEKYFSNVNKNELEFRFQTFVDNSNEELEDQTIRFAANYAYQQYGKWGGMFSEITSESELTVKAFNKWISIVMTSLKEKEKDGSIKEIKKL